MAIINKEEIREYYHEYLLDIHKNWNKPGNKTDTASQRVTAEEKMNIVFFLMILKITCLKTGVELRR